MPSTEIVTLEPAIVAFQSAPNTMLGSALDQPAPQLVPSSVKGKPPSGAGSYSPICALWIQRVPSQLWAKPTKEWNPSAQWPCWSSIVPAERRTQPPPTLLVGVLFCLAGFWNITLHVVPVKIVTGRS